MGRTKTTLYQVFIPEVPMLCDSPAFECAWVGGGEQGALLELCFTQDKNYEEGGGVKGYIWRELSSVAEEAAGTMKGGSFPHAAVLLELENAWVFQRCGCYLETI